jgi:hypothetical protein
VFYSLSVQRGRQLKQEQAVGRKPPFREDLSLEAGEQLLLEAVTRQLLVKTLQAGKDLA